MRKAVFMLIVITVLTKILGFIREIALAYYYGASYITDAYLISLTIPVTIFTLIGTGIVTGYIPIYSKIVVESGIDSAKRFTTNLINIIVIFCLIICVIVQLFTPEIVRLFASGFDKKTLELTVLFTRISIFSVIFYALTFLFNGYLEIRKKFIISAISSVPLNLIILFSFYLGTKYSILIISIGSLLAALIQMIFLLYFVIKSGYRHRLKLNLKDDNLKKMVVLTIPVVMGISVNQINILVDRTIASQITTGGISALSYANNVNQFIQSIFVVSIATVIYPMISKMAAERDFEGLKKILNKSIGSINILIIPVTVGTMFFSSPIIVLLFGRGAFANQATLLTASALFFYSIGMIGFGLREVISRAFYSMQDTKKPMINAAIGMVLNIILNIILSRYLGIGGLALATSISAIFTTVLLFFSLRKKIGQFGMKQITISFFKILSASLTMGILAKSSFYFLNSIMSQSFALIIAIIVGALAYIIIIFFIKVEEVDVIITAIKKKFGKANNS